MIVLADNDILIKLARCDLFDEFLTAFDVNITEIRILKAARFSVLNKKQRKKLSEASFTRLTKFLALLSDIDTAPDPNFITALTEQTDKNIDAGEADLFAICPLVPHSVIVTGDKKCLAGLVAAAMEDMVCHEIYRSLAGKIVCFELVLSRILEHFGFEAIRQKLIDGRECDGGLKLWLGSGLDATEATFRDGLTSYLNQIRQTAGPLLRE
ncbi:MAG: hypothetical protein ACRC8S_10600 [Fimbriiglobus sp.]